ncbi:MAG: type I restriction-modification system endonuclease [Oscillospiraceae bacterium]|nr:type I restriction-modification system endonuclease [Oscillospiraceae bacterium]
MTENFLFLAERFPALEKQGSLAESYLYSDPNTCIYKLGMMAETIVKYMLELDNIETPEIVDTPANRIKLLKKEGMLPRDISDMLYALRTKRNIAVHEGHDCLDDAKILLEIAHTLSIWFMQTYGDYQFQTIQFILPSDDKTAENIDILLKEKEEHIAELEKAKASTLSTSVDTNVAASERRKRAGRSIHNLRLSERETRYLIDEQLRRVGWEADTENLRYSKGTRPEKGRYLAIAEWPTDSSVCSWGSVDYALFADLKLLGVIEAKANHRDVPSVIDNQCRDYSMGIKDEHSKYVINSWDEYKAPFLFATNGRPYLKQLETKSGIWFRDARDEVNIPRALQGWIDPQGLLDMLEKDIAASNRKLAETSYDLMADKDGLNLRPYQIEAIEKAEAAIIEGKQTVLLAMATGTGKTRTVLGMIYRFLETERFKRVLFLVDRTTLGEQAQDVFKEVKIEELLTIDKIYDIKELDDNEIDKETKIHVATVQSLVRRVIYNDTETMPSVTDYDLIVIDEAHRGYILDKDMSDDEQLFRDQTDYVSKYRTVIEYFDAVKIALTATPALHTTEIFGKPVFEYSYRRAVIEGYLVDHDVPHIIETELSKKGIIFKPGETVPIIDTITGEITNIDELEDELSFDVESFNRNVITENFNRAVLEEIAKGINPEGDGKTLVFAANDDHADLIVKILKEIYEPMGIPNDAIMKITGSIGGGNPKKVLNAVKRYKNEFNPNIAVTVDLLTTGIDVLEITTLVFIRRVKSRILFEQMMGRATRLCPRIKKTHFEIYDTVGVYESLEPVSNMKPVVQNQKTSFDDLLNGLESLETEEQLKNQIDVLIAKIHRKKRDLKEDALRHFIELSGGLDPTQFTERLSGINPQEAKEIALRSKRLFDILDEGERTPQYTVISNHDDAVSEHTRGYGKGKSPEDYLEEFDEFITSNINTMAALKVVCTKPQELTRESLKSLKLILDENNFNERQLNTAWRELKNEDIAADIISYIRRYAIGSPLISSEERIKSAVEKLRRNHDFTRMQLDWLDRIEKTLQKEIIIDQDTFNTGAFKTQGGGFSRIDRVFNGKLNDYLLELNRYLYDDGGNIA